MKIRYKLGNHPVPMIALYKEKNKNLFLSFKKRNFGSEYNDNFNHLFNIFAYIIYDEVNSEIKSLSFDSFAHLVYLLRSINKNLSFSLNENKIKEFVNKIEGDFKEEFEII